MTLVKNTTESNGRRAASAFTLIELLVVIAIIAILAAILFPVFAQAREKARQTSCLANVKSITLALNMYAQDYDEVYPMARYYNTTETARTWDFYIEPYAQKAGSTNYGQGNQPYLVCPSDSVDRTPRAGVDLSKRSYALPNSGVGGSDVAWKGEAYPAAGVGFVEGRPLSEFTAPASTMILAEAPLKLNRIGTNDIYRVNSPTGISGQALDNPGQQPSHSGGWNYGFADGHAKWMKPEQTVKTAGITYSTSFRNANGYNCYGDTVRPCGIWTLSDND